jgi:hypothetical protein
MRKQQAKTRLRFDLKQSRLSREGRNQTAGFAVSQTDQFRLFSAPSVNSHLPAFG